jgi:hypothetical protein
MKTILLILCLGLCSCGEGDVARSTRLLPYREKMEMTEARVKEIEKGLPEIQSSGLIALETERLRDAKEEWRRAKAEFDAAAK